MGLTVEEVNEMQDTMFKIDGIDDGEADAAKVAEAKATEDAAKLAEAKAVEDAAKAKADADAKASKEAKEKKDDSKAKDGEEGVDAIRELKEQVRASKEALNKATSDYQKLHKIMVDKGLITTEEIALTKAEDDAAKAAYTERQNKLTEMVTIMELNPTYTDVRTVCSQGNLDDIVDAFSRYFVKENGGELQEVAAKMESEIWAEPNPYKKIYELVKKYHPKFAKANEGDKKKDEEDAAKKIAEEADGKKKKEVVDAQVSAANIGAGGGGAGGSGWTAAKIDAMDEELLHTVPKDIYEKYLLGTLK